MQKALQDINKERKIMRVAMGLVYIFAIYATCASYLSESTRNAQSVLNTDDWVGGTIILILFPVVAYIYEKHMDATENEQDAETSKKTED